MWDLFEKVDKAKEGYYVLKPEYRRKLADMYEKEYYQNGHGSYANEYELDELKYFHYLAMEKNSIIRRFLSGGVQLSGYWMRRGVPS